jgi:hypothetical protein
MRRLRPPAPSCLPARAAGGFEVKRSQGRRAVPISHCAPLPGRPVAGSAAGKKAAVTNRDKKDGIRGRMAETGEPFNVARRKAEAAAGQVPEGEDIYQLIEVEVGTDHDRAHRRHFETFWGRWVVAPDPDKTRTAQPGQADRAYYGVAQTRRGRIAVYRGIAGSPWGGGRLDDYDTLDEAQIPADIRRQTAAALGIREVIHRDI